MEATHVLASRKLCSTSCWPRQRHVKPWRKRSSIAVAVLTPPADNIVTVSDGSSRRPAEVSPAGSNDCWFDQIAIHHLSQSVQAATGTLCFGFGFDLDIEKWNLT